jgi:hypothetical protein
MKTHFKTSSDQCFVLRTGVTNLLRVAGEPETLHGPRRPRGVPAAGAGVDLMACLHEQFFFFFYGSPTGVTCGNG